MYEVLASCNRPVFLHKIEAAARWFRATAPLKYAQSYTSRRWAIRTMRMTTTSSMDLRNQAIVVHAITPLTAAIRGQPLAVQARIAASFKVTTNPRDNHGIDVTVKFL